MDLSELVSQHENDPGFALEVEPLQAEALVTGHGSIHLVVRVDEASLGAVTSSTRVWVGPDEDDYRPFTLGDMVAQGMVNRVLKDPGWEGIRRRIAEVTREEIREQVTPMIADTLTRGFPKTNSYGEPVIGTTTLSELIMAEVKKVLTQGAPNAPFNSKETVLQRMVADAVRAEFARVITDQVAAVRKEIAEAAADQVKAAVLKSLKA